MVLATTISLAGAACSEATPIAATTPTTPTTPTTAPTAPTATTATSDPRDHDHGPFDFGEPAEAADADRVIELVTRDDFTYTPDTLSIALGETITFLVTNEGVITHDFTLGRSDLQDAHDIEMAEEGGMEMAHGPNAFLIAPGTTMEVTWHFTEPGDVLIACHVPGHYAAGMKAAISVEA